MNITDLKNQLQLLPKRILQFRIPLCLLALALAYGFIIWRVNVLGNAQPDPGSSAATTSSAKPQIDQATVNKIKQLQDNSVSVKVLFDQSRQNPFHE